MKIEWECMTEKKMERKRHRERKGMLHGECKREIE